MSDFKRIWLQKDTDGQITWCQDKINDDDTEYIRADLFTQLEEAIAKYEEPATCNGGHKTLPLKLWDCPECTAQLEVDNGALRVAIKNTIYANKTTSKCNMKYLYRALKESE